MILFLSESLLRRLDLIWKPSLTGFMIGQRNLFFFVPDSIVEVDDISPMSIDAFLNAYRTSGNWQLLGFISPKDGLQLPGYARVETGGELDSNHWKARISLLVDSRLEERTLEIRKSAIAQTAG